MPPGLARAGLRSHAGRSSFRQSQRAWVAAADTFFIASAAPGGGADASHRGGNPGFVRVRDAATLEWPDYSGNTMFNTLGNITADTPAPACCSWTSSAETPCN